MWPVAIFLLLVLPGAILAKEFERLVRVSLLVTLPLGISVVIVNLFFRAGGTVLVPLGPLAITREGLDFTIQILLRLFAMSTAVGLFVLTTDPRALVMDLETRRLSPRFAFVALATIEALPAMIERAQVITDAQRARGLDTEGGLRARLRGVLPLVGPVIISSLTEVEERSLALEVRGFGRPGRRELLWTIPDTPRQAAFRWLLMTILVLAVGARILGILPA